MSAKIFRSIIKTTEGLQLELLPRERLLGRAVERLINCKAIQGPYTWEVHELTIMGDSKQLVTGSRGCSFVTGYLPAEPISPPSKEPV